jgi:hypothetical protein
MPTCLLAHAAQVRPLLLAYWQKQLIAWTLTCLCAPATSVIIARLSMLVASSI